MGWGLNQRIMYDILYIMPRCVSLIPVLKDQTWATTEQICQRKGGHLVSFEHSTEIKQGKAIILSMVITLVIVLCHKF